MLVCTILYFLLCISLFVASFSAFKLSPSMRDWIGKALATTSLSLAVLATLPTQEALKAFYRIFLAVAALLFIGTIASEKIANGYAKNALSVCFFICFYTGLSIRAWSERKEEIFGKFLADLKSETVKYPKYFAILSIILLIIAGSVSAAAGEFAINTFTSLITFLAAGMLSLLASIWLANSASLVVVFGPALAATGFLWLTIYVARISLWIGSQGLVNLLVLYAIIGTMYFTVMSFPELMANLGIPSICR